MKPYRLLIVAHPDDETIFFAGQVLSERGLPWHLITVTDGNGDGRGAERKKELAAAVRALKIQSAEQWEFPDIYDQRISQAAIQEKLAALPLPAEVYTHGPLGDYGHPHHQDISLAVHRFYCPLKKKVWSPAWNSEPQKVVKLSAKQFAIKTKIMAEIYHKESIRFQLILPVLGVELFRQFSLQEVDCLVKYFRNESSDLDELKQCSWMKSQLPDLRDLLNKRMF